MLARLSVWSKVQTCICPSWCHCHSLSLASVKSRLVLPFWYRLTWVVPEKWPLNVCVCVCAERERKRETDRQKEKQIFSHETSLVGVLMYKAYQSTLEALATMHYTDWCFISHYITFYNLPSVLWHFVRHQEEHPACKKWRHCIPKLHHLLPQLNPDWLYLSGTGLPRLSWKRGR